MIDFTNFYIAWTRSYLEWKTGDIPLIYTTPGKRAALAWTLSRTRINCKRVEHPDFITDSVPVWQRKADA
jgi:hypothetical protein